MQPPFPLREADRRVSEQEARFAFVLALAHEPPGRILFAPENPTRGGYRFAHKGEGTKAQRARTDISLYDCGDKDRPLVNMEFKASERSGNSANSEDIRKDMAKLVAEGSDEWVPDGVWFHVVRSVNNNSLNGLLRTFRTELALLSDRQRLADYTDERNSTPLPKRIAFHICILHEGMRTSIHRVLDYDPTDVPERFLSVQYKATLGSLEIEDPNHWSVYRR